MVTGPTWFWFLVAGALYLKAGAIAYEIDREILQRIADLKWSEDKRADLRILYRCFFWATYLLIILLFVWPST